MEILLFKKTEDKDLSIYLKIVYQDKNGQFTKVGTITKTEKINELIYYTVDTSTAIRTADKLKLIK